MNKLVLPLAATLLATFLTSTAAASVVVSGTRVIYPQSAPQITVKLDNRGAVPALVQAWIDSGDEKSTPATSDAPFTLTPPIFRMEAGKGQNLRIIRTTPEATQDRESVYWLNVLEVPPKAKKAEQGNTLQFAFRTRLKLFYRPDGLPYPSSEAHAKLTARIDGKVLVLRNDSVYHLSFASISSSSTGAAISTDGGMVAPKKELRLTLPAAHGSDLMIGLINDFGATVAQPLKILP